MRIADRAYGSWIFGAILLIFVFAVFWLAPDALPSFKQQILAFSMALLAGLFGFFLTGDMTLAMQHKESSTSLKAAGGIALFVLVLAWWQSSAAPVIAAEAPQAAKSVEKAVAPKPSQSVTPTQTQAPKAAETQRDSSIHSNKDAKIRAANEGEVSVILGNGQVVQGKQTAGEFKEQPATPSNSSISSDGNLVIEATGNGKVNVVTGNGQIQQAE
ncbi:MAG: hypothetical protein WBM66_00775 [Thiothrix litoralis]